MIILATGSILRNVKVNTKPLANKLAYALENAEKYKGKPIVFKRTVSDVKREEIKAFFGDKYK